MSELLDFAIAAHGGWDRWENISRIVAKARIGGALWGMRGKAGILDDVTVTALAHSPHLEYAPFGAAGRHSLWEPDLTAIVDADGRTVDNRLNTRESFEGLTREDKWDDQHLIYFSGYAMWTYLTTPFLFKLPGFLEHEVEPWDEDGETWRRLRVLFPPTVPSHSTEQTFYFDRSGILKRHDYVAEVAGGLPAANYADDPQTFDGIVFPTKRRVYVRDAENKPMKERLAVSIDFDDVRLT